jgi:hypothetical protein
MNLTMENRAHRNRLAINGSGGVLGGGVLEYWSFGVLDLILSEICDDDCGKIPDLH